MKFWSCLDDASYWASQRSPQLRSQAQTGTTVIPVRWQNKGTVDGGGWSHQPGMCQKSHHNNGALCLANTRLVLEQGGRSSARTGCGVSGGGACWISQNCILSPSEMLQKITKVSKLQYKMQQIFKGIFNFLKLTLPCRFAVATRGDEVATPSPAVSFSPLSGVTAATCHLASAASWLAWQQGSTVWHLQSPPAGQNWLFPARVLKVARCRVQRRCKLCWGPRDVIETPVIDQGGWKEWGAGGYAAGDCVPPHGAATIYDPEAQGSTGPFRFLRRPCLRDRSDECGCCMVREGCTNL